MTSSGAGSASMPSVGQPRGASARRCVISANPASSGDSIQAISTSPAAAADRSADAAWTARASGSPGGTTTRSRGRPSPGRLPGPVHLVVHQRQHGAGRLQQHGAGLGQLQALAPAVQQLRADELLQPPDLLAQGRLGDEHTLRGVRETTRLGHRHEVPQMPQLNSLRRPGHLRQRCLAPPRKPGTSTVPWPLPGRLTHLTIALTASRSHPWETLGRTLVLASTSPAP